MSAAPCWWTPADDAELDVLFDEFVGIWHRHRDNCETCSSGPWCDGLRDCFQIVLDWKRGRELRSKAEWLRVRERVRQEAA
jgi:hypothetical protein